jgi:hypothetical protein
VGVVQGEQSDVRQRRLEDVVREAQFGVASGLRVAALRLGDVRSTALRTVTAACSTSARGRRPVGAPKRAPRLRLVEGQHPRAVGRHVGRVVGGGEELGLVAAGAQVAPDEPGAGPARTVLRR